MPGVEDSIVAPATWRSKDRLIAPSFPLVMGILNVTPDSFHAASRIHADDVLRTAGSMLEDGAAILDIGGASSRPGSEEVPIQVELDRVIPVIEKLHKEFPEALLSIDTYRSVVAEHAVLAGAGMVNDIGAGLLDAEMFTTISKLNVPYVLMHMQGRPRDMQKDPRYDNVVMEVIHFLSKRMAAARDAGIADLIIDPGFGFGKTTGHNFSLLRALGSFNALGVPVLAGLSRKRMINEILDTTPANALNGTTVMNTLALLNGADILRVHDVQDAVECIRLQQEYRK